MATTETATAPSTMTIGVDMPQMLDAAQTRLKAAQAMTKPPEPSEQELAAAADATRAQAAMQSLIDKLYSCPAVRYHTMDNFMQRFYGMEVSQLINHTGNAFDIMCAQFMALYKSSLARDNVKCAYAASVKMDNFEKVLRKLTSCKKAPPSAVSVVTFLSQPNCRRGIGLEALTPPASAPRPTATF